MATPLAIQIPPKSSSDDGGSRSHEVRWHPDDPHQPMPGVLDGRTWDEWSKKERAPISHGDRCSHSDWCVLIWRASPEQPECDR